MLKTLRNAVHWSNYNQLSFCEGSVFMVFEISRGAATEE